MSEQETIAIIVLVGVLFTAVTGVVTALLTSRQKALEVALNDTRAELAATRAEVEANEKRIAKLERRDRAWANYVHKLRAHIEKRLGPPPPDWPEGLDV